MSNKKGAFIVFEGIDGSGKSTQIRLLSERLKGMGLPYYNTMEPNDSPIGAMIHQIMIGRMKTDNKVIAALFVADRLDHLLNEVNGLVNKIEASVNVICDRYYFSSYAYQSVDLPMDWVIAANEPCRQVLKPTVTIFIDMDPDVTMDRIEKNRAHKELFEEKSRQIQVRDKYLEAFEKQKDIENIVIIDGHQTPEAISEEIWGKIKSYF